MMGLEVIILAAGSGKRMVSGTPKVLHCLGGIPLLQHVVQTAQNLSPHTIRVICSGADSGVLVRQTFEALPVSWVEQSEPLGTGHAVLQALPLCEESSKALILYGDVPLITSQTLKKLLQAAPEDGVGLIVAHVNDPKGLGRILRDTDNNIVGLVEEKDATDEQRNIQEINAGLMCLSVKNLKRWLPQIQNRNKSNEYYLTDIIGLAASEHLPIVGVFPTCPQEVQGINDRWELLQLERYYQQQVARRLMSSGVWIQDPTRFEVLGEDIVIEPDVSLGNDVSLAGKIRMGAGCRVGPYVILKNVTLGRNVVVLPFSILEDTVVHDDCQVGPFARLRANCVLESHVKIGNFVELKKTTMGAGSKANHLSYLGDAVLDKNVNIGAGTITCNFDGYNKWATHIGEGAFIGSNSSLVAPIDIGPGATIGAGSTITRNAPADALTLARNPQKTVAGWKKSKNSKHACAVSSTEKSSDSPVEKK